MVEQILIALGWVYSFRIDGMELIRKIVFLSVVSAMLMLFIQVGDFSLETCNYIQDRIAEMRRGL
jgi:hypothetical protein